MTLSPAAAGRLSLLGCGLLAALTLALSGCGEEGSAAKESATAQEPQAKQQTGASQGKATESVSADTGVTAGCPPQLDAFVKELRVLRRRLAVGLSYEQYTAAVKGLRASYDAIPVGRLTLDCLTGSGTPGERALNKHVDAANAWGECLADATCTTAMIEPVLQRKWRVASEALSATE